jgi:phosphonopyruvate decarboxylase
MVTGADFATMLKKRGLAFFCGVPCSVFRSVIPCLEKDDSLTYVPAVNEGIAVSLSFGAALAKIIPTVIMQNTGLGNALEALVSLPILYRIPMFLIISWRGYQRKDEIQHWKWADIQNGILDQIGIRYWIPETSEDIPYCMDKALDYIKLHSTPASLILTRGLIDETR